MESVGLRSLAVEDDEHVHTNASRAFQFWTLFLDPAVERMQI